MIYQLVSCVESKRFSQLPIDFFSVWHAGKRHDFIELSDLVSFMSRHSHCQSFRATAWHRTPLRDIRLALYYYFRVEQPTLFRL